MVDYKATARMYLLPRLGEQLLAQIDAQAIMDLKAQLLTEAAAKAAGKERSGKPLSPRTVVATGLRSGEIRGLVWDSLDLEGKRLFVEHQATRRRADDATKTENALRTVPLPAYLIPELMRWKLACPPTELGLVFPGEPDGERNAWAD